MHRRTTHAIVGTIALAAATSLAAGPAFAVGPTPSASASPATFSPSGRPAIGLTADGRLITFGVRSPGAALVVGAISGLTGDTRLVGIDHRVQDSLLYGVGDQGGVYTISPTTAVATKVSQLTVALSGTSFGVDFNPAADRLRIVSDNGQNLSHNVNAGGTTTPQTTLTLPPATMPAPGITGAAYTNNDLDPNTGTTLFDVDTAVDQLEIQSPPGNGLLVANGKLGVDAVGDVGFDIFSVLRDGTTRGVTGFVSIRSGDRTRLYSVSLLQGRVDSIGRFPRGLTVVDIAVQLGI